MTVGQLRELLADIPDHHEITAGAPQYPEPIVELRHAGPALMQLVVGTEQD